MLPAEGLHFSALVYKWIVMFQDINTSLTSLAILCFSLYLWRITQEICYFVQWKFFPTSLSLSHILCRFLVPLLKCCFRSQGIVSLEIGIVVAVCILPWLCLAVLFSFPNSQFLFGRCSSYGFKLPSRLGVCLHLRYVKLWSSNTLCVSF